MSATKDIMGIIPTLQGTAMLGHSMKAMKKKKKHLRSLTGVAVGTIVGASLIKHESNIIGGLD